MANFSASDLTLFSEQILRALGVAEAKARLTAAALVAASLRGVDSHGMQLLPFYVEQIESGDMDAVADGHVVSESGCCLLFDGENGIGQGVAGVCCERAIFLARQYGAGVVVARESKHFGAGAY